MSRRNQQYTTDAKKAKAKEELVRISARRLEILDLMKAGTVTDAQRAEYAKLGRRISHILSRILAAETSPIARDRINLAKTTKSELRRITAQVMTEE